MEMGTDSGTQTGMEKVKVKVTVTQPGSSRAMFRHHRHQSGLPGPWSW